MNLKEFIEKYKGIDENGEYEGIRGLFVVKGLRLCKHNLGEGCPLCVAEEDLKK